MNRFVPAIVRLMAAAVLGIAVGDADVRGQAAVVGVVHEAKPTDERKLAEVRIQIAGAAAVPAATDAEGRFAVVAPPGAVLEFSKPGYEPARITIREAGAPIDVAMMPVTRTLQITRSGKNDCAELPAPPAGVPGVREYARFPVHHDGAVTVIAAQLPFASNPGFLYRQTPAGWVKNEFDYVLLRQPLPVVGGFWYVLTFGAGTDNCGPWSLDATHPS